MQIDKIHEISVKEVGRLVLSSSYPRTTMLICSFKYNMGILHVKINHIIAIDLKKNS